MLSKNDAKVSQNYMIKNLKKIIRHITGEQSFLDEFFISAAERSDLHALKKNFSKGADINAVDQFKETALFKCCKKGAVDCVEWLLKNGANPTIKTLESRTILHKMAGWDRSECIDALADFLPILIEKKDAFGNTALNRAAEVNHFRVAEKLIYYNADIETKNNIGLTPLYYFVQHGNLKGVALLIKAGADIDALDNAKHSAIDIAAIKGHQEIVDYLEDFKKAKNELSLLNKVINETSDSSQTMSF